MIKSIFVFVMLSLSILGCSETITLDYKESLKEQLNFEFPVNVVLESKKFTVYDYDEFFTVVESDEYQLYIDKYLSSGRVQSSCDGQSYTNVECHQFTQPDNVVCACWAKCADGSTDIVYFGSCNGPS